MNTLTRLILLAASLVLVSGCSKSHDHGKTDASHHEHAAPHGGTLIELGEHAYNVELLRDRATGTLTAWILDGHAENFVRIKAVKLDLVAMPGGKFTPLALQAVANPTTGETVGDSSQFEVRAEWLKTAGEFAGILTVEVKGTPFEQVSFSLPE